MGERDKKLEELGYPLDDLSGPSAIYRHVCVTGKTVYVSGAVPRSEGELVFKGKVPSEVSIEEAQKSARLCMANNLRVVIDELGSLDRIKKVVRVTGYVNSDPDFQFQHLVINGASELLIEIFGEDLGKGARSAVGMAALPDASTTETELILELAD